MSIPHADAGLTVGLDSITARRGDYVGGKGASLATVKAAGFMVPDGFCITASAFRNFIRVNLAAIELDDVADFADIEVRAEELRGQITEVSLPKWFEDHVVSLYKGLTADYGAGVAVRSSALGEDSAAASFAGQHDSILNVSGQADLLAAIRRCWASVWSDRAIAYRRSARLSNSDADIAVVVQRMVEATRAGVLFTANPQSGKRDEMVIEASFGLGEPVVSGAVRPDHYRISTITEDFPNEGCLSGDEVRRIHGLGTQLQALFGYPVDVEWAIDASGVIWIVQCRPITSLFPVPASGDDSRLRAYWSLNLYQGLNQPFTPMGAYIFRQRHTPIHEPVRKVGVGPRIAEANGWLYWDITEGICDDNRRRKLVALLGIFTSNIESIINHLAEDPRFPRKSGEAGEVPPRFWRDTRWNRMVPALLFPERARRRVFREAAVLVARFSPLAEASATDRLRYLEDNYRKICRIEDSLPPEIAAGYVAEQLVRRLLRDFCSEAELFSIFQGVTHNPTLDMDFRLWAASSEISGDRRSRDLVMTSTSEDLADWYAVGALPAHLHDVVFRFLTEYGFRGTCEIDIGHPRWSEDPRPVFEALRNYLRSDSVGAPVMERFAEATDRSTEKAGEVLRRLPIRRLPQRLLAQHLIGVCLELRGMRELGKQTLMEVLAMLRNQLLIIGTEISRVVCIENVEDVMFLELPEVRSALGGKDLRELVSRRKESYMIERNRRNVPAVILSDGTVPGVVDSAGNDPWCLTGLGASAGIATGTARLLRSPEDASLDPGDILVTSSTDPGWTPLFLTAGAIVTEYGGMGSHGPTVAREFGIPAVVGVSGAMSVIPDGAIISVDGISGTVTFVDR